MKIVFGTDGIDAAVARMRGLAEKKIRVAARAAVNVAARHGAEAPEQEMSRVFDRPTNWVLKGVRYKKATLDNLEAQIDFDAWGNKTGVTVDNVLRAEIFGGTRKHKRHEVALHRVGILPAGMHIVPGTAAQMDGYGNMKSSQIVQIIAWFRAFGEQGYKANMTDRTKKRLGTDKRTGWKGMQYFALQKRRGKLVPGIYQRFTFGHGSAVKPVMIFVRAPLYRRRFDFYGVAERAARQWFEPTFSYYLGNMLNERGL